MPRCNWDARSGNNVSHTGQHASVDHTQNGGEMFLNYTSPKTQPGMAGNKGEGLWASDFIHAGETIVCFAGYAIDGAQLKDLPASRRAHGIQVDDDLYIVGPDSPEPGDFVNHSCDPTCGIVGNVLLVSRRDILPGEEITFDYAMSDSTDYDEFDCQCGTLECRGRITGNDWTNPELQDRYDGHFSAYLQRKIDDHRAFEVTTADGADWLFANRRAFA